MFLTKIPKYTKVYSDRQVNRRKNNRTTRLHKIITEKQMFCHKNLKEAKSCGNLWLKKEKR